MRIYPAYIPVVYIFDSHFGLGSGRLQVRSGVSLGHPFDFAQGRLLGSVWAFFNYMGGVKDLRCKTRLVAWDKRANHRDHRGKERAQRIWAGGESGVGGRD
jgi:hypothetical protein